MSELVIRPAILADLDALAAFMRHHGTSHATAEYLRHWYFGNPSGSASLMVGWSEGRIVGMATTNDHHFQRMGNATALVGMPQKVLTDESIRGKGVFGKLHRASEAACLERGVDFFLTVTNAASTPIFLSKFGYHRAASPGLIALAARPGRALVRSVAPPAPRAANAPVHAWSMHKDAAHFAWRYAPFPGAEHRVLEVGPPNSPQGVIMLRKVRKLGLPFQLLMDALPTTGQHGRDLLLAARAVAWREGCAGVLVLEQEHLSPWLKGQYPRLLRSSGFNLLVKGRDAMHTQALIDEGFELAFGDLDFF